MYYCYYNISIVLMEDQLDINEFVKLISCPLTKKIFNVPVLGSDGVVYEEQAYLAVIEINKKLTLKYRQVINLRAFISTFLASYPDYKKNQYV